MAVDRMRHAATRRVHRRWGKIPERDVAAIFNQKVKITEKTRIINKNRNRKQHNNAVLDEVTARLSTIGGT
mgnify:CR=1 FL=1